MQKTRDAAKRGVATSDDIARILGDLDPSKMLPILGLRPSILDVEEASMWLAGDRDVFGPGLPLHGVPGQIVSILTRDEEEEEAEAGVSQGS
jgi:hypothetical protein